MTLVLLRCVDVETSGLEPTDSVVEIGTCDVRLDTETLDCVIGEPTSRLFRPRNPMGPDVVAIHHLTNEMLAYEPLCEGGDIRATITTGPADFMCAHSWKMEGQWFTDTLLDGVRPICTLKAARRFLPDAPNHNLQTLRYFARLDLDANKASPPHRAGPDAYVTAHLLAHLLQKHRVRDLVEATLAPLHFPTCPLFKHKGPWADVPRDYLVWMAQKPNDLDGDLKAAAQAELDRRAV